MFILLQATLDAEQAEGLTCTCGIRVSGAYGGTCKRLIETWWPGSSLDTVDELCSASFIRYGPASEGAVRGPEGLKQLISRFHELVPDLDGDVVDQVAEGDKVASRWVASGSHQGQQAKIGGIIIHRIANGKIEEEWAAYDAGGMMQQLGVS